MSRRVGYSRILESKKKQGKFATTAADMEKNTLENYKDISEDFRLYLTEFIKKHRKKINANPLFRLQFLAICDSLGIDPLARISTIWSKWLNLSSFYSELAVKVLDVCIKTRGVNGGICDVVECLQIIQSNIPCDADDVLRAIAQCQIFGEGLRCITISHRNLIVTTATTLTSDHQKCLGIASSLKHGITSEELVQELKCNLDKVHNILDYFIRHQIAWIDDGYEGTEAKYWFPALHT
ncbi:bifunctional Winged helix-like DNA-binding domain superfamily/Winged helix DNA-binding domain superfamily/ESCRT-2 complex [Babesia duncani]|uniref:Bifunctional Winged helix-like DNA-binding domain superfamily/Winged helix DNA-binding domain superfamily/ESCRT-2 complex n=1 Tax=Babesia duncani TaxID=323732 RepID=A0AAD9PIR4_9APIC|nr:bifunctional Winged helix-like DNA-binding domain superfamily/Winged helix DNA-binding domain superfamily/ESCRT-2 complex [Babesia duncani]